MNQKILRYFPGEQRRISGEELRQILLEIVHKQAVSVGGYDAADIYPVFLQMVENMAQLQLQIFAVQSIFLLRKQIREHMVKDLAAQTAEQIVLGFKMGIEGTSSDIGFINDFLYSNGTVGFLLQQGMQRIENCRPCFFLTSIQHNSS